MLKRVWFFLSSNFKSLLIGIKRNLYNFNGFRNFFKQTSETGKLPKRKIKQRCKEQ